VGAEAAALIELAVAMMLPDAYVDLGAMLSQPKTIVFDASHARGTNLEPFLRESSAMAFDLPCEPRRSSGDCAT